MNETELKFTVPAEQLAGVEKEMKRARVRVERLQASYYDTPDERLASHRLALRLRREGRRWVQTAKAETDDSLSRLEHNAPVSAPRRGSEPPTLEITRHDGTPAGDALRKALGKSAHRKGSAALTLRFRTDVSRATRTVRIRGATVEIALDTGKISTDGCEAPICELEFELKRGGIDPLIVLAAQWAERHGLWLSTLSKAERGARLARGETEASPVTAGAPRTDVDLGAAAFLASVIESCLTQVFANAGEIASGAADEGFVHQLRIGLRRLRTALRELSAFGEPVDPQWEPSLRSAFRELGEHRDAAVVMPWIGVDVRAAGAPAISAPKPLHRARRPATIARDAALQRTLLAIFAYGRRQAAHAAASLADATPVRQLIALRLDKLHRRVAREAKHFVSLEPERRHGVRKRLKRLRYMSEFAAPLFGQERVERYMGKWREAQDALGKYNDERIAAETFQAQAATEPTAWFAVGWIAANEKRSIESCQRALQRASKAKPFWKA